MFQDWQNRQIFLSWHRWGNCWGFSKFPPPLYLYIVFENTRSNLCHYWADRRRVSWWILLNRPENIEGGLSFELEDYFAIGESANPILDLYEIFNIVPIGFYQFPSKPNRVTYCVHMQIREGRFQPLDQCLAREYRTSLHCISKEVSGDFCEVRAVSSWSIVSYT